jgi:hypothetical protein
VSLHVNVTVTLLLFHPLAFGGGVSVAVIVGGGGSVMVAVVVAVPATLRPSSTIRETVNVPADEYVWLGEVPEAVVPSPKFHE